MILGQIVDSIHTLYIPTDTAFNRLSSNIDSQHQFTLSPNPAIEETTIKLSRDLIGDYFIEITDIVGKIQERIHVIKPQEQIVSLSKLHTGSYVINLLSDDKILDSQKIMIIK